MSLHPFMVNQLWSFEEESGGLVFHDPDWPDEHFMLFEPQTMKAAGFTGIDQLHKLNPRIILTGAIPKNIPDILRRH